MHQYAWLEEAIKNSPKQCIDFFRTLPEGYQQSMQCLTGPSGRMGDTGHRGDQGEPGKPCTVNQIKEMLDMHSKPKSVAPVVGHWKAEQFEMGSCKMKGGVVGAEVYAQDGIAVYFKCLTCMGYEDTGLCINGLINVVEH